MVWLSHVIHQPFLLWEIIWCKSCSPSPLWSLRPGEAVKRSVVKNARLNKHSLSFNLVCSYGNNLEKEMATHSSILAWGIPWTEEPGGLPSIGLQRVGRDWATNTLTLICAQEFPFFWIFPFKVFLLIKYTKSMTSFLISLLFLFSVQDRALFPSCLPSTNQFSLTFFEHL